MLEKITCPMCGFEDEYDIEYDDDGFFTESPVCKHCGEQMDFDTDYDDDYGWQDFGDDDIDVYEEV